MMGVQNIFQEMRGRDFWIDMAQFYSDVAIRVLIPFATTYKCEAAFSALLAVKTKSRNGSDATNDMRVALAETKLNIGGLVQARQVHSSH